MELKKGYKQTEIGIIPEDWEVKELGETIEILTDFTANGSFASLALNVKYKETIDYAKLIRLTDIRVNFKNQGIYISKNSYDFLAKSKLYGGELLLANVGAYSGYSFLYPENLDWNASLGPNMFLIKFYKKKYNNKYMYYQFCYGNVFNELTSKAASSAQPKLNKQNVRECNIPIPKNIKEQTAIANALTDIDDLISALEEKIEKKKNIKQGAMQELLKPKEGWVEKRLGEVGNTYGGLTGKSKAHFGQGNAYYIPFMNILSNPIIDIYNFERVSIGVKEKQNKVLSGDLFFNTSSETPEEVGICSVILDEIDNLYLNSFCFGYRLKDKEISGLYLSYFFRSKIGRDLMTALAQGATRYNLSKSLFNQLKITLPKSIQEQNNICDIINDMDKEIEGLVEKLEKYRMIKEGMMKDLLTGRIRLI